MHFYQTLGHPSRCTAASMLRCILSADRTVASAQHAFAGPMMFNTLPDDLRDPSVCIFQ